MEKKIKSMKNLKITILGCGDAKGVPRIACNCKVCQSAKKNTPNSRTRSSLFIQIEGKSILIDSGQDFRTQAIREDIKKIDAVIFTHDHADHILGYDDLMNFNRLFNLYYKKDKTLQFLKIYAAKETHKGINQTFPYLNQLGKHYITIPYFTKKTFSQKSFNLFGLKITPTRFLHGAHGYFYALKFQQGNNVFSYIPDMPKDVSESKKAQKMKNSDLLISAASAMNPKRKVLNYLDIDEMVSAIKKMNCQKVILTHLSHHTNYYSPPKFLPKNAKLAYDGMEVELY